MFHLISMEICSSHGSIRRIHTEREMKWKMREKRVFTAFILSRSHLELELDSVKNGEHTSQPTRDAETGDRRTGFLVVFHSLSSGS